MRRAHLNGPLLPLALCAILAPACKGPAGTDGADGSNGIPATVNVQPPAPAMALVKATRLPPGDANCPAGGTRIDTGFDDGSNGGTAGDGILEPGEVASTTYDCNDGGQANVGSFEPPSGAEGTHIIDTHGGNATAAASAGGDGGAFGEGLTYGSAGGHVKLFKTGQVDASFTFPTKPASFDYGGTVLEVTSEVLVHFVSDPGDTQDVNGALLTDGDIIVPSGCSMTFPLAVWHTPPTPGDVITGVHIASGGSLTFDHWLDPCSSRIIEVAKAFVNEGTLTVGHGDDGDASSLSLQVGSYYGAAGSTIDLRGESKGTGTLGGSGGNFSLSANASPSNSVGSLWNQGTVDVSGGTGDDGGDAGTLTLWANGSVYNTGDLSARGGDAATLDYGVATTHGGDGAKIDVEAGIGSLYNSGTVNTSAGRGSQQGGTGGQITVRGGNHGVGDLYNTGRMVSVGGDVDATCNDVTCLGGDANQILLASQGGDVLSSADLVAHGGEGRSGVGGSGKAVTVIALDGGSNASNGSNLPGGAIWLSGDLDAHGADGAIQGGQGGEIQIFGDPDYVPMGQEVTLLGYGRGVDTSGGDAAATGGRAGDTSLYQNECAENEQTCAWPAGSVINYVDFTSTGGAASAADGVGGNGGTAIWDTVEGSYAVGSTGYERLVNHGNLDTSGGQGGQQGGASGSIWFYGLDGVENAGLLTANGGGVTAPAGTGGDAGIYNGNDPGYGITLGADRGSVVNTFDLSASGGNATDQTSATSGGNAAGILLDGPTVQNSGYLSALGGNTNTTAGYGGDGANVVLESFAGATDNQGPLLPFGGTGAPGQVGADGYASVDGQLGQ